MAKKQIVYKAVRLHNGTLRGLTWHGHGVKYDVNVETRPPHNCGPLAAFNTLDNAQRFVRALLTYVNVRVYRAIGLPSESTSMWTPDDILYGPNSDSAFYTGFPLGTILCDSIELLYQVYPEVPIAAL